MSFIPQLIIDYDQLVKYKEKFELYYNEKNNLQSIYRGFHELLKGEPFEFKGIKMISYAPDLSGINKQVREWLYDNNIDFAINN